MIRRGKKQILILTGATATGKSSIVTKLHQICPIEIIVADSVQIRKNVDLGATKPSAEEMKNIPHHLVNLVDTKAFFSAGDYIEAIQPVLCDILRRDDNTLPTIVGGNTMWVDWLINGVPDAPESTKLGKQETRRILQDYSHSGKWDEAVSLISDLFLPEIFQPPSRNDWHRLHRFLEVYLAKKDHKRESMKVDHLTKRDTSILKSELLKDCDVRCFFISGDRLNLYRTIDARCEIMIEMGLVEEVCKLLLDGHLFALPENTSGFAYISPVCSAAIGYRQTINYLLQDNYQFENPEQFFNYLRLFTTATRNYAKHQLHWYHHQDSFLWLHPKHQQHQNQSPRQIQRQSKGSSNHTPMESLDGVAKELYHWMNVPREEYENILTQQIKQALLDEEEIKLLNKKATRDYHNPDVKWSAQESMLRACEGNTNPEMLRRYMESFHLQEHQHQNKLKGLIRRIDKCRLLIERTVGRVEGLRNEFLLRDHDVVNERKPPLQS